MSHLAARRQQSIVAPHRSVPLGLGLALLLVSAPVARADIDLTGTWDLRTSLVPDASLTTTIVQTGSLLSVVINGSSVSGTIDPVGGVFFLNRSSSACDDITLTGLATQDGNTMTGSGGIEVQLFPSPCAFREIEFAARRGGRSFACGNGNLDPGESCDDGNQLFGDCCTPVCTFNAPGWSCSSDGQACTLDLCDGAGTCTHRLQQAGTLCRGPAGLCDVAETCDGTSPACPPDELLPAGAECRPPSGPCDAAETCNGSIDCPADVPPPDTDQDGVADACDVCPNGIRTDEPWLRLGKYDGMAGNDTLLAKGEFGLSSAAAAFLDPVTQGFRVVVGQEIGLPGQLDVLAPPGAYDPVVKQGWKVSRSGLAWKFRGSDPALAVTKVSVKLSAKDGQRVTVKATGKRGSYAAASPDFPLRLALVLEPPGATSTACGEAVFADSSCKLGSHGAVVDCR